MIKLYTALILTLFLYGCFSQSQSNSYAKEIFTRDEAIMMLYFNYRYGGFKEDLGKE